MSAHWVGANHRESRNQLEQAVRGWLDWHVSTYQTMVSSMLSDYTGGSDFQAFAPVATCDM